MHRLNDTLFLYLLLFFGLKEKVPDVLMTVVRNRSGTDSLVPLEEHD